MQSNCYVKLFLFVSLLFCLCLYKSNIIKGGLVIFEFYIKILDHSGTLSGDTIIDDQVPL